MGKLPIFDRHFGFIDKKVKLHDAAKKNNIIGAQIARRIIKISLEQYFMVDYSRTANDQIESI